MVRCSKQSFVSLALMGCTLAAGCGGEPDNAALPGGAAKPGAGEKSQPVVTVTRAEDKAADKGADKDTFTGTAKTIVDWSGAIANLYGTFQAGQAILTALGILSDPNQDIVQQLQALHQQIDQVASRITWFQAESDREQRLSDMRSAVFTTNDALSAGRPVDWFNLDLSTAAKVAEATDETAFQRNYVESDTNGTASAYSAQSGNIGWKRIIGYTQADLLYNNGFVYDWRLGVPALTQLISLRLQLMALEDPNFTTDGRFSSELMSYHDALQAQIWRMNDGIRCNTVINTPEYPNDGSNLYYPNYEFWVSCADIYSGINDTQIIYAADAYPLNNWNCETDDGSDGTGLPTFDPNCQAQQAIDYKNWYQTNVQAAQDQAYRNVRAQTPWFGLQALTDAVYLFANGLFDLTHSDSTIRISANTGLCLDVPWGSTQPGTVVQIYGCNGSPYSQAWTYNRLNQSIVHANSGLCLEVQNGNGAAGTPVWTNVCNGSDAQRWSYDPKNKVLNNKLTTVLDVPWANLQSGQTLWAWSWNGSDAQHWQ